MAAIAPIAVYDGAATPVLHNLYPVSITREKGKVVAYWRETLPNVPIYAQVAVFATVERMKSGVWKTECRVEVPVMESVAGNNSAGYTAAPKVAYVNTSLTTGFFHERSDVTGRRTARQIGVNVMGNIATTVAPATTGFMPDLFDQLVAPT